MESYKLNHDVYISSIIIQIEKSNINKILNSHKVKFIGPSSKSILELGNKSNALNLASDFKLPILGNKNSKNLTSTIEAQKIANKLYYFDREEYNNLNKAIKSQ